MGKGETDASASSEAQRLRRGKSMRSGKKNHQQKVHKGTKEGEGKYARLGLPRHGVENANE